jgi:opacity protein-like surface antigen
LDLKISHRFGNLNTGTYELFGLDNATMRFGFDYGLTDRFTIGVGRSTFEKQYDGFAKYKLLRQSSGKRNMPISVSALASIMLKTQRDRDVTTKKNFSDNLYYTYQLLIARKFSSATSFQIMPTVVHHNIVQSANEHNDIWALGVGGRQKVSKRVSINAEYYYVLPEYKLPGTYNSLAVGVDIETGGHVFQLHFTNSTGMTERTFISETTGQWSEGDIRFGFNVSRIFNIGRSKKQ